MSDDTVQCHMLPGRGCSICDGVFPEGRIVCTGGHMVHQWYSRSGASEEMHCVPVDEVCSICKKPFGIGEICADGHIIGKTYPKPAR